MRGKSWLAQPKLVLVSPTQKITWLVARFDGLPSGEEES